MVYSYTPTYYSSLHDSITSICKTILPFSLKKRRLEAAEHKLAKLQSDNLKWQQDSFHQILNLMGLHKEGILAEHEVSAFRSHLLETLLASPVDQDQPAVLKDKLLFLQDLLYGKCISEEEYRASKRPLLKKLAIQGVQIEARDVTVGGEKGSSDEEWSVIDLKDENCLLNKEKSNSKNKSKHGSAMKSVLGFTTPYKPKRSKEEKIIFDPSPASSKNELSCSRENPFWNVHFKEKDLTVVADSSPLQPEPVKEHSEKLKRKPFRTLFHREQSEGHDNGADSEERVAKSAKKQWGFEGLKKWKRSDSESETAPLPLNERSDSEAYSKTRCDRSCDDVPQVERSDSRPWAIFDEEDENCHPNLFAQQKRFSPCKENQAYKSNSNCKSKENLAYKSNSNSKSNGAKIRSEPDLTEDQNPFWIPGHHGSS